MRFRSFITQTHGYQMEKHQRIQRPFDGLSLVVERGNVKFEVGLVAVNVSQKKRGLLIF